MHHHFPVIHPHLFTTVWNLSFLSCCSKHVASSKLFFSVLSQDPSIHLRKASSSTMLSMGQARAVPWHMGMLSVFGLVFLLLNGFCSLSYVLILTHLGVMQRLRIRSLIIMARLQASWCAWNQKRKTGYKSPFEGTGLSVSSRRTGNRDIRCIQRGRAGTVMLLLHLVAPFPLNWYWHYYKQQIHRCVFCHCYCGLIWLLQCKLQHKLHFCKLFCFPVYYCQGLAR